MLLPGALWCAGVAPLSSCAGWMAGGVEAMKALTPSPLPTPLRSRERRGRDAAAGDCRGYAFVPPTVMPLTSTVGMPTPTGTDWPSLPQVQRPSESW